jgi:hypothetical protein
MIEGIEENETIGMVKLRLESAENFFIIQFISIRHG